MATAFQFSNNFTTFDLSGKRNKVLFISTHTIAPKSDSPNGNVRRSFLIFPTFTPLLTLEMRTFGKLTAQLETNIINTHGVNLEYFINEIMNKHFVFVGTACI